ncbi:hypothetical protein [Sphingomonas bacterium]|uniref:hypothetical protein n=1 Tax=Sphingomonas bacterium TaxID=1895847 RepID=UPI0020C70F0B|nr:hypothetical protein [Sphingomonas bacterium]
MGDALAAIRNVVLMQERLHVLTRKVDRLADDVRDTNDYVLSVDKRVIRIETIIEMGRGGSASPRIEQ